MSDEPTNGELKRLMERDHSETASSIAKLETHTTSSIAKLETQMAVAIQGWTAQLRDYVLKEVWATERDAQRKQLDEVKDEVTSARRRAANAVWAAGGTLVCSIAVVVFKGGH